MTPTNPSVDDLFRLLGPTELSVDEDGHLRRVWFELARLPGDELVRRLRHRAITSKVSVHPDSAVRFRRRLVRVARSQLRRTEVPAGMVAVLDHYLEELSAHAELAPYLPPFDFPMAVHQLTAGRDLPASLALAFLLHYVGLHMLDDFHDDELPANIHPREATMVATMCIASLPAIILEQDWCDDAPVPALLPRLITEFATHTYVASIGQLLDISRDTPQRVSLGHEVLHCRNGAMGRLLGRVSALAAGSAQHDSTRCERAIENLCVASQIMDDVENLWLRPVSSDAVNRAKTLPLCYGLQVGADQRAAILELCGHATPSSHDRLRALITATGALHFSVLCAELHVFRARRHLAAVTRCSASPSLADHLIRAVGPCISYSIDVS